MLFNTPPPAENGTWVQEHKVTQAKCIQMRQRTKSRYATSLFVMLMTFFVNSFFGCSLIVKEKVQCEIDGDCHARGEGFEGTHCEAGLCVGAHFDCLGGEAELTGPVLVPKNYRFVGLGRETAPEGLLVKVCAALDLACSDPLQTLEPDSGGRITITMARGFKGSFDILSDETMPTQLIFLSPVQEGSFTRGEDQLLGPVDDALLPLFTEAQANALALSLGDSVDIDIEKTQLFGDVYDCEGTRAEGIIVQLKEDQAQATTLYIEGGAPQQGLTETTEAGAFVVVNMRAGLVTIDLLHDHTQSLIAEATVPLLAGHVAFMDVSPAL